MKSHPSEGMGLEHRRRPFTGQAARGRPPCWFLAGLVPAIGLLLLGLNLAPRARAAALEATPLLAGWATVNITPPKPVALIGQLNKRISTSVRDPLTATVLALETVDDKGAKEQAVLVSCDVLFIPRAIQQRLQDKLKALLPDLDPAKLVLNATHTHTGPGFIDSTFGTLYDVSQDTGVMKASEYADFFLERLAPAVVQAWRNRQPTMFNWALGYAVISHNRRAHYFDGSTVMYGKTDTNNFSNVEGSEDHRVKVLGFWNPAGKLQGLILNLACTAQETEHLTEVSADFWHDARMELRRRHGEGLFVLPQCAPAGDLSPHLIFGAKAEQIMNQRRGLSQRQEIARRIADAVDDVLPVTGTNTPNPLLFRHVIAQVNLPELEPAAKPFYETDAVKPIEVHVIRLGDVVLANNPFELYLDYATRIEARSPATLTLLMQLAGANCGYLPTEKAVQGGGYSADKYVVGPPGGQVLVEETVKQMHTLWR